MDSATQEALSKQHYGLWCVPLDSGAVAVFSHPNGKLLKITSWADAVNVPVHAKRPVYTTPTSNLNLGGLDDL